MRSAGGTSRYRAPWQRADCNAVLRAKHRLIDELIDIPRCQGWMRLIVRRQGCRELLARHPVALFGERQECPDSQATVNRVQAHRPQLIRHLGLCRHANFHIVIAKARIQPRILPLLKQHAYRMANELSVKCRLLAPAEFAQDAAALLRHGWWYGVG